MRPSSSVLTFALCFAAPVFSQHILTPNRRLHAPPVNAAIPPTTGEATFTQLLDHRNPEAGNFSQTYWWNDQFYKGPGSPVVVFCPGEANAAPYTGYLTNRTLPGLYAEAIGGAVILIEHRYWGTSSPFDELTTENLQYQTLENAISDLTYFARNVQLPFDKGRTSTPDKAPWLLTGGSYSGALAAWTETTEPGTYWAYHASSAPVEAIVDYWSYFAPVQLGMPKNCSTDVSLVVDHVDSVLSNGTSAQKLALKDMFGLGEVVHDDDFALILANGPFLWQSNQFYENGGFFDFCDDVENSSKGGPVPGAGGVGLDKALAGYANWVNTTMLPGYCESYGYFTGTYNVECFDTYTASNPMFTDTSLNNTVDRAWEWFLCNEPLAYWQDGAPENTASLMSRLVTPEYFQRQCSLYFPTENGYTFGSARGANVDKVNARTQGWDVHNAQRLLFVNGGYDPWRESGVSSDYRPGGPMQSTAQTPIEIVPGGFHTSDLLVGNGAVNAGVKAVQDKAVQQMVTWVNEFPKRY